MRISTLAHGVCVLGVLEWSLWHGLSDGVRLSHDGSQFAPVVRVRWTSHQSRTSYVYSFVDVWMANTDFEWRNQIEIMGLF
jgi:hypothetical protein